MTFAVEITAEGLAISIVFLRRFSMLRWP